jgi:5-methylcytosine-specific restriction endonuclease McrA
MALRTLGHRVAPANTYTVQPPPKTADPYYLTLEHKAWAAEVVRRAGKCCQDCGRAGIRLFADHIKEIKDGGDRLDPANGRALCGACHSRKTAAERAKRR